MGGIKFRLVKILDIIILTNLYLLFGCIISSFLNYNVCKDYDNTKSKFHNLMQLIFEVSLIAISVYFIRVFIKHGLPNPLNGLYGFNPIRVKERNGGVILAFAFLMYMDAPIRSKVNNLYIL
jgi:hypothetical protein